MFCTVLLASQGVLVQSLQPKGHELESTYVCLFFLGGGGGGGGGVNNILRKKYYTLQYTYLLSWES